MGRLFVGTSGYRYWPGDVHPPGTSSDEALRLYAKALPSVELNRSFYALPRASTISKFQSLVPPDFVFAVKISRVISHEKKLLDIEADWNTFFLRVKPLLRHGALLLQLSKTFPHEPDRLEQFLRLVPQGVRLAVEFRHDDWFMSATYRLLERHGAALVGVGAPKVPCMLEVRTAPFVYYRLHGPRVWYKDRYSEEELRPFISATEKALEIGDAYVYFDNTIGGHAYWNALEFQMRLRRDAGQPLESVGGE